MTTWEDLLAAEFGHPYMTPEERARFDTHIVAPIEAAMNAERDEVQRIVVADLTAHLRPDPDTVESLAQSLADAPDARLPDDQRFLPHLSLRQCVRWVQNSEGEPMDWEPTQRVAFPGLRASEASDA